MNGKQAKRIRRAVQQSKWVWENPLRKTYPKGAMFLQWDAGSSAELFSTPLIAYFLHTDSRKGSYVWTAGQTERATRRGWYISRDFRCRKLKTAEDITEEIKTLANNGDDLAIAAVTFLMSRKLNGHS